MSFLNATLLFGALAVLVPIALHMLGRREPTRVKFPAVRFLTQRLQSNRRRMQVKRWVLLAMRVLLLGLLALALAQPEIHRASAGTWLGIGGLALLGIFTVGLGGWAMVSGRQAALRWGLLAAGLVMLVAAGGWSARTIANGPKPISAATAPAAVVFLIDNGPTMGFQTNPLGAMQDSRAAATHLQRAQETATWLLGRYPQESRFALLDRSARPAGFAIDVSTIQKGLGKLQPLQSVRPLGERIEAAIGLLNTSDLPRRTLFIMTDLTESSWSAEAGETSWPSVADQLAGDNEIAVHVVDVGTNAYQNYSLADVQLYDATPAANVPSSLSVSVQPEIQVDGESPPVMREVTVQLRLFENQPGMPLERDGAIEYPRLKTVDRKKIAIGQSSASLGLTLPPLDFGTHHGLIDLVSNDPLAVDNTRYFTIRVEPPKRVLLICDSPDERRLITSMLNPFGSDDSKREYEIDFASSDSFREVALSDYPLIGMFNPKVPPILIRNELDAWVRAGGSLFVALGPAIAGDDIGGPVDWPFIGNPKRVWLVPEPGKFAQVVQAGHPSLRALTSAPGGSPWGAFRIYQYWQLDQANLFSELLRYSGTEHIALGERNVGSGRLMVLTTPLPALLPPADRWNDLLAGSSSGTWEVYLILLRQIFEDLAGGASDDLNVAVGQPVALRLKDGVDTRFQLFAPNEVPAQVDASAGAIVPGIPLVAGNYWLRGLGGASLGYSANLSARATSLVRIDTPILDAALGADQYRLVRDREEIQLAEGEANQARPLYAWVMMFVAAMFFLEQVLANRFYASADTTAKSNLLQRAKPGSQKPVAAA